MRKRLSKPQAESATNEAFLLYTGEHPKYKGHFFSVREIAKMQGRNVYTIYYRIRRARRGNAPQTH